MHDKIQRFSLRKLSVGLASVMVGACIFSVNGKTVKADVTSDQTTQTTKVQGQTATAQAQSNDVQSEKKQTSSDQNSVADQSQKNLLDDLGKQKASAQSGDQAEAKNQENRLVDQINYKLTNNTSTDNKKDLGQNLTAPDETKSTPTIKNDAEKSIVGSSSIQQANNQSNSHAEDNSQSQNEQKLDITKNSKKLAKKVLATNLIETNSSPMTNGGFDEATWGKLDVTKWQGSVQDGIYQLTKYTGNFNHIIVPNEADFEKAGKSTNGLQVGIDRDTVRSLLSANKQTIAFSKTNNQKVKAIGTDWSNTFSGKVERFDLSKFDGSGLDVSNVTDMHGMFDRTSITDFTSLANWNVSNVTDMTDMFSNNYLISDLKPLANWDTSKVTDMASMFSANKISNLTPLANWDISNVTNMSHMFSSNSISDLKPLANWDTSKVTNMSWMFSNNSISDLKPLANWDTSKVTDMSLMFESNSISDLKPLANWDTSNVTGMSYMFQANSISDLTPLANWNTSKVTDMSYMFQANSISDLTPLTHWDTSKVTNMSLMFADNPDIIDLKPIANWNISNADNIEGFSGLFMDATQLNLTNINNTKLMQSLLKAPYILLSTIFITNNADLVKATIGKDLPTLTNTAKRTIVFKIPHAESKTITQTIYYKTIAPVQIYFNPDLESPKIVKTYPVKDSDWQLDTSKQNDDVIIDGVICFKPVKIPHVNGYKAHLIKDPVNPTALLVSFMALPQQSQNNQSTSNNDQSSQKTTQDEQNQPEPIQTTPVKDKQTDQILNHIAFTLMHNDSSDTADSFEPAQDNSDSFETPSDSTQKDDTAKPQKVNAAKRKKHIVKKRVAKRHKKHAKKYHLKRRSRKHTKRAKKRIIKHRKNVSRKFRKHNLKHIKKN